MAACSGGTLTVSSDPIKFFVPINETLNALFDRSLGLKADIGYERIDICESARHVSGLQRFARQ